MHFTFCFSPRWTHPCGTQPQRVLSSLLQLVTVWTLSLPFQNKLTSPLHTKQPEVNRFFSPWEIGVDLNQGNLRQNTLAGGSCHIEEAFVWLCDKAHLHTYKGAQRQNSRKANLNNTLLGYNQAYHRSHQPISISSEEHRGTVAGGNTNQGLPGYKHLVWATTWLSNQSDQPQCPSVKLITIIIWSSSWDHFLN